ncbi:Nuclear body protein SP140 [Microtus ochrogaster]|uniref:Nuclear body protein SP140 n=1 Tax=Microtus ochrogaster TaxID=79684 RepID=A0A8J6GNP8_MICOH|nr:Nuclear body protein SP140 [Microtus ochrogaster]
MLNRMHNSMSSYPEMSLSRGNTSCLSWQSEDWFTVAACMGPADILLRASSEYSSEEESPDYGLIFKHFRENKVEIASAITRPFPFLMSLRDRGYISEQKFRTCQQSCENLIPPERVVYDILSDLQNEFSLSLLKVIFCATHLKAYPDLKETLRNFPGGNYSSHLLPGVQGNFIHSFNHSFIFFSLIVNIEFTEGP